MKNRLPLLAAAAVIAAVAVPAAAQYYPWPPAPPPGVVCQTPVGWCGMPVAGPVGGACWCATPYGPVNGFIR